MLSLGGERAVSRKRMGFWDDEGESGCDGRKWCECCIAREDSNMRGIID
jgi:hypothetical protein